jgi:hypothetical protein
MYFIQLYKTVMKLQEKYNNILSKIEKFFIETINTQEKFDPPDEEDDNKYV